MNGLTYAYIGDAYYELFVRKYFIDKGYTNVGILHSYVSKCTSGVSQAKAIKEMLDNNFLTTEEIESFKHGRNAKVSSKRKVELQIYMQATGFEALIGYLSLVNEERCKEVIIEAIRIAINTKEVST